MPSLAPLPKTVSPTAFSSADPTEETISPSISPSEKTMTDEPWGEPSSAPSQSPTEKHLNALSIEPSSAPSL